MLLASRRVAFLHLLLAAMQAAWIAPFLSLAWPRASASLGLAPWQAWLIALGGLLAWMLVLELLSRAFESPLYDTLALGLLVAAGPLLVRLVLYRGGPPWDVSWIGRSLADTANWTGGLPPLIVLLAANLLLWQRATSATSRDLNFFGVGMTFRGGLLLLLVGGALYGGMRSAAPLGLLWLYLGLGLTAVAVSRISEKAADAQSTGRLLPARRLLQTLAAAAAAIGVSWLVSLAYTDAGLRSFFRLFDPVWQLVRPLLLALLVLVARVLNPMVLWLEGMLIRMLGRFSPELGELAPAVTGTEGGPNPLDRLLAWPFELARDALVLIVTVLAVLGLIIFLLLYLERVRRSGLAAEAEDEGLDRATFGGGILGRALDSLRGAAGLVRRFGVSRDLLAAISVQNIYANLCRLARRRGKPRLPSQPPDDYLPVLGQAFPGQDERLRRITTAYMRVHYGDQPVGGEELASLREDYRVLREGV